MEIAMLKRRAVSVALPCFPLFAMVRPQAALAQSGGQPEWRYCGKCYSMFFDGFQDKGRCAAGGAHQAIGFRFVLPHDQPETPKAQRNWRYCGKCHGMFFDGFPQKGRCPAGAGHQAIGFNFVLPHDVPGTHKMQPAWRFCLKCSSMFFDGFPQKGSCAAGGDHQAAGFNFVLPHEGEPFANALEAFWRDAGRGIVAEQIRQSVNGMRFAKGVSGHNCNPNLGEVVPSWRRTGPTALQVVLDIPGNNVELKTTTPTVFGSYADPSFRIGFKLLVTLAARAQVGAPNLAVDQAVVRVSNASVHGTNASGTLTETVADFFGHGSFSRSITDKVNQSQDVRVRIQHAINAAMSRLGNLKVP